MLPSSGDEGPRPVRVPRSLPRGKHSLSPDVVLLSQRARILEGMVEAVAAKGYAATTVADVIARAGVSRATFYGQFRDKEACFLAAHAAGARAHYRQVAAAGSSGDDWIERLRAGNRVYLAVLAEAPSYARALLIEVLAAGRPARDASVSSQQRYVELLKQWHAGARREMPDVPELPDGAFEACVAATNDLVVAALRRHDTNLVALEPLILYVQLAILGLPEAARATLAESTST